MKAVCNICPHHCAIEEGKTGLCRARTNTNGKIVCENYGKISSIALDPIEKKPFKHFYEGRKVLSVGSYGCNFKCAFCQNSDISMADKNTRKTKNVSPHELVHYAIETKSDGNIGIAYTYNEPLIGYEFVLDCSKLIKQQGLKNVVVTNGYICKEPLTELLYYIDAMNIDLKAFSESFYKKVGGDLETVKATIRHAAKRCHVEVTTLIIPGENDSEEEIKSLSSWLASVNPEIPLHITRFFPRWNMRDREATPLETIYSLSVIASNNLRYVYTGNI
ncbi:MAG: AmmeMemoRadiSam system radical SAM enzyme [Ruminiclostridium sp.]|nr:AmmeMemoRadiSam system radical SAM enzyme [Ruminiclostridium sp.]